MVGCDSTKVIYKKCHIRRQSHQVEKRKGVLGIGCFACTVFRLPSFGNNILLLLWRITPLSFPVLLE